MQDEPVSPLERFVDRLVAWRWPLFVVAIVVAVAAIRPALSLEFDQRIESLYAADDPNRTNYLESRSLFGGDELAIVAWSEPGLFDEEERLTAEARETITAFAEKLSAVPGVISDSTQHLARALDVPYARDEVRGMIEGLLVDAPGETTGIVLRFRPEPESPISRGETIRLLRELAADHSRETGSPTYVLGEPVQVHDMFRLVEQDGNTFFRWTLLLLAVVAFATFRSVRWTLLPLVVVVVTILWTRGLLATTGVALSMVSSMLNSIVTIIGVATVMHVVVRFREHQRTMEPEPALRRTLVELLPAVYWTCGTTCVGFLALLSSSIAPVRSFAVMMALATAFVFVAVCMLLPLGTLVGRLPGAPPVRTHAWLSTWLDRLGASTTRRPWPWFLGGMASVVVGLVGMTLTEIETDFSRNFHEESQIIRSLEFYEGQMGGAGTWEVNFGTPEKLDEAFVDRVRRVAERLRSELDAEDGVTHVVAITDGLDLVPKSVKTPSFLGSRSVPIPMPMRLKSISVVQPEFVPGLYNADARRMRIVLRAYERVPAGRKRAIIERAEAIVREEFPEAKASGLYVLLVFLVESLLRDQVTSFVIAAVGALGVITLAFRSLRIGLIALVPNLFPLCLVMGAMGWLGVRINIGTTMIACVSLGLTTDATVHFLAAYRRERREGLDPRAALRATTTETGRAIVFATIALVVGFSVLGLSNFVPLVVFGWLVDASMVLGLYGDLVLLPILLGWGIGREDDERSDTGALTGS